MDLVGFYSISNVVGYLTPNFVYTYSKYIGVVKKLFVSNIFKRFSAYLLAHS